MAGPSIPSDPALDARSRAAEQLVKDILASLQRKGQLVYQGRSDWSVAAGGGTVWELQSLLGRASYGMPHVT